MSDILFKIGNTDLTQWVKKAEFAASRQPVYESWTDGNWIERREYVRTRLTGTVPLSFTRAADFNAFIALLTSERNVNGYYPVTIWESNSGASETISAFLTYTGDTKFDVTCPRKWHGGTVAVYER